MQREEEEVRRLLKENGTFLRQSGGHDIFRLSNGALFVTYPKNRKKSLRAWKNQLADLKRRMK